MQVKRKGRREEGGAGIHASVLARGERVLVCAFVCAGADEARQHVRPPLVSFSTQASTGTLAGDEKAKQCGTIIVVPGFLGFLYLYYLESEGKIAAYMY